MSDSDTYPGIEDDKHEEGKEPREKEMSFFEHLEELRWRIIRMLIGIVLGTIVCWVFIDFLIDSVLLLPITHLNATLSAHQQPIHLQNLQPFGQLFVYMEVAIVGGVILSLPNVLYQIWAFIAPGLMPNERKYVRSIVAFSTLCFLAGIVFAYFVMLPAALQFFAGFGTPTIQNNIAINEYMSFIISVLLAAGVVFELPMVSWFLSKIGILRPEFMRKYRRHSIVVIFILAAVLTPGTDPVSQILLAIPLLFLYEISILVSVWAWRGRKKKEKETT
ncbi:MAG: twin-arginine translocase subunit TatC [Bacteroidota bacterium]